MAAAQIKNLLVPPRLEEAQDHVSVYLNTQFRTIQDLGELSAQTKEAHERKEELQAQFSSSQLRVDALITDTRTAAHGHLHSAQELSLLRHSLADELSYLSEELVSSMSDQEKKPTILEDIETLHRNLKELQSVKGYVQIIEQALKLSEAAVQRIQKPSSQLISSSSLVEYNALKDYTQQISAACTRVEDGGHQKDLQLVTFIAKIRDKTWRDIKGCLSETLLSASEKLKWPMPIDYLAASVEDRKAFEAAFINMLKLQTLGEQLHSTKSTEREGLYPLQTLVQPMSLRFKYHFEGSRQTNRLDKPEWYFIHVINITHEHRPFVENVVQNILSASEYKTINAWREFVLLLLPLPTRKLKKTVPSLLPHPSLLAHTIYQALIFDASLAEAGFSISGTTASKSLGSSASNNKDEDKWEGISEVILGRKEWFDAWVEGERLFVEDQYQDIISAPEAWLIADDDGEGISQPGDVKTTNSARRITALVEQVTDRYTPLPHFSQRTRFLVSVQIPILENYYARISSSLNAFESLSSVFVRAVPGALGVSLTGKDESRVNVDTGRLTAGVEGVQRLCKALVSAKHVELAMQGWREDLFFLELWAEINSRETLRARVRNHPALPAPAAREGDVPQDTLFEVLISQFSALVDRSQDMIIQHIVAEVDKDLRVHYAAALSSQSHSSPMDEITISQTLLAPIALLTSHLRFLQATLPHTTLIAVYRLVAAKIAETIFHREILYRGHRITAHEGKSTLGECELWNESCLGALKGISSSRVDGPWLRLLEAARLVSMEGELWNQVVDATFGSSTQEQWEEILVGTIGISEMTRAETGQVLKSRQDCNQH